MWRWMPVIARNSSFVWKGRSVDVKEVGRTLGARYVLEGSVRRAGNRVRITCQLVEAETGYHVWAERYDRVLADIFDLQDEITEAIVSALEPAVGRAEMQRARLEPPANLDAWELTHRAFWHFARTTEADFAEARDMLARATRSDPAFAKPHSILALIANFDVLLGRSKDPRKSLEDALTEARAALDLDPTDPFAHAALGATEVFLGRTDDALSAGRRSVELNPSFAIGHHIYGIALVYAGRPREGVESISCALRISPNDPVATYFCSGLSLAHYTARDYEKAVESANHALQASPHNVISHRFKAAALGQLGRVDEARSALRQSLVGVEDFSAAALRRSAPFREDAEFQHLVEGLRKAGWDG